MGTLAEQLVEAEAALHRLLTGSLAAEVTDSNGERVRFGPADHKSLSAYVADLRRQIAGRTVPKTIIFTTSKGL